MRLLQTQTETQNLRLQQLTRAQIDADKHRWDKIIANIEQFLPREMRKGGNYKYSEEEIAKILAENIKFGLQIVEDINQKVFLPGNISDISYINNVTRRLFEDRIIIFFGYGQGYDSGFIEAATNAGYKIWFIDISNVACCRALEKIYAIYNKRKEQRIKPNIIHQVWREELSSILLDPSSIGLDLDNVEGWYMCRSLFALDEKRAKFVLQIIGQSLSEDKNPDKHNWAYLVNPLTEDNPNRVTETSIKMTGNQILSNVRRGSRRRLKVEQERNPYFDRVYTSFLIKAE